MGVPEKLFYLLINEQDIETILRESPFESIREEASEFIEDKIKEVEVNYRSMERDQRPYRNELRTCLDLFISNLERERRNSVTYINFKRTFMG